jgi:hypothetical protein
MDRKWWVFGTGNYFYVSNLGANFIRDKTPVWPFNYCPKKLQQAFQLYFKHNYRNRCFAVVIFYNNSR